MRPHIALVLLVALSATAAHAAQPKDTGWYVGGGVGFSSFDDDGLGNDTSTQLGGSSPTAGLFGGYKLMPYFALEGRFTYLGDGGEDVRLKATALTVNAVGILPLGSSGVELFGQAGLGGVLVNDSLDSAGATSLDNELVGTYGIGARVWATERTAFSIQLDRYSWEAGSGGRDYDVTYDVGMVGLTVMF